MGKGVPGPLVPYVLLDSRHSLVNVNPSLSSSPISASLRSFTPDSTNPSHLNTLMLLVTPGLSSRITGRSYHAHHFIFISRIFATVRYPVLRVAPMGQNKHFWTTESDSTFST